MCIDALLKSAQPLAVAMIEAGAWHEDLVHLIRYPVDHYLHYIEVMALSTPLPRDTDLSRGGYTSRYYKLADLAGY